MATERLIGIDFGTSTTVIRVKRYRNGEPISDRLETKAVTFNMGNTMVPTLVKQVGDARYFGYEAANTDKRGSIMYQNFKVDLENEDTEKRDQARSLTRDFMKYLAGIYREQSEAGHLGESDDREWTLISYPVKWKEETKRFMVEAARDAGFPNVEGMDEASAAIQAVTVQNADLLSREGYFKAGVPVNILLIDMGAGTTDLVLCRHTPGKESETKILCTWPKSGNVFFGGSQVDVMLRDYIKQYIPAEVAEKTLKRCGVEQFKSWKEKTVSPALKSGEAVNYCAPVQQVLDLLELDMEPFSLDRTTFEANNKNYLALFSNMITDCLREAGTAGSEVDLVILTGGHSQWYFVQKILGSSDLRLSKIIAEPERMITIALPQETVALGLVFSSLYGNMKVVNMTSKTDVEDDKVQKLELREMPMDVFSKALREANAGDPTAEFNVACSYAEGNGVPRDILEAVKWYKKAAEHGIDKAQFILGVIYENGEGVEQSYEEANKWYRKAAHQGFADAQWALGSNYEDGYGVDRSTIAAFFWYRKAAEQGHAIAQWSLGVFYYLGWAGGEKDSVSAVNWFKKSADQGFAPAQNNLGVCYRDGIGGLDQNDSEAVKWFIKAAEQGYANAQANLGNQYMHGEGIAKNRQKAAELYIKAAEQGDAVGQYNLAICYEKGDGVRQNQYEAVKWYKCAAEQGNADAQLKLGIFYEKGSGVKKDYTEAIHWYQRSAEQENAAAQSLLGSCYLNGKGVEKDYNEALKWYRKSVDNGCEEARELIECVLELISEHEANDTNSKNIPSKPVMPEVEEATPDSEFDLRIVGDNYEIVGYHGNRSRLIVPETIRGKKVVAFSGERNFHIQRYQYVSLPKTVTRIGRDAFRNCLELKEVHAHGAITVIEEDAFKNCYHLEVLDFGIDEVLPGVVFFPPTLKRIEKNAFSVAATNRMPGRIKQVYISKETMCQGFLFDTTFDRAYTNVHVSFYEDNPKK